MLTARPPGKYLAPPPSPTAGKYLAPCPPRPPESTWHLCPHRREVPGTSALDRREVPGTSALGPPGSTWHLRPRTPGKCRASSRPRTPGKCRAPAQAGTWRSGTCAGGYVEVCSWGNLGEGGRVMGRNVSLRRSSRRCPAMAVPTLRALLLLISAAVLHSAMGRSGSPVRRWRRGGHGGAGTDRGAGTGRRPGPGGRRRPPETPWPTARRPRWTSPGIAGRPPTAPPPPRARAASTPGPGPTRSRHRACATPCWWCAMPSRRRLVTASCCSSPPRRGCACSCSATRARSKRRASTSSCWRPAASPPTSAIATATCPCRSSAWSRPCSTSWA